MINCTDTVDAVTMRDNLDNPQASNTSFDLESVLNDFFCEDTYLTDENSVGFVIKRGTDK